VFFAVDYLVDRLRSYCFGHWLQLISKFPALPPNMIIHWIVLGEFGSHSSFLIQSLHVLRIIVVYLQLTLVAVKPL